MAQESEAAASRPELPMRLTRLRVKNFRSIADIDIPLSPLTVLVGPNGSGKSNVVDALRFVRDVFARGLDQAVMDREGMGVIQRWGTEEIEIGIEVYLGSLEKDYHRLVKGRIQLEKEIIPARRVVYSFAFSKGDKGVIQVTHECLKIEIDDVYEILEIKKESRRIIGKMGGEGFLRKTSESIKEFAETSNRLLNPRGVYNKMAEFFEDYDESVSMINEVEDYPWEDIDDVFERYDMIIKGGLFYNHNPNDLRQPQQVLKESPLDEKGRNLAAVLRQLFAVSSTEWDSLIYSLRQTVIGFNTLEIEPVGGYLATKLIYQTDTTQPRASYLGQESDGTIRMLGLLAALYQDPAQPFLSIEEPEANIHPGALAVLAGVLDEASLRSQILVTTHSPDMLDHLPAESFLVVEKVGDTTHVGQLDASQLASVRKRLFTPGELLRMEGLHRQPTPDSAA